MNVLLLTLAALLGLVLIAFGLPGTWLFLVAAVLLKAAGPAAGLSWTALGIGAVLALIAELGEWVASMRWTTQYGGSRRAAWGALAGGIVGAVIGLPIPLLGSLIGSFAGSFLGALAAEYSATRNHALAGQVAWGALIGRLVATALKMAIGVMIAVIIIGSAWR
jgi:uncharacterized protein YqgC (DUF456 family)